ncbi:hypothetical protein RclHR1_01520012 [Rhizophagus clarus]|uniref:F-box domain-containing protein n=1 Tax=Rhizophagus clarus TaxID=94130 RepID=A0A2Z6QEK8_9GLOM|nr:hypothetical protein RclHR1_01520012 [Rhizophagus clarus]GES78726.1 hypothetical protein GLOIN_2v1764020 [Rhizophagus clarus]
MSKLNRDILFMLFEELQDDSKSLFSCLIVNKLWCETAIPILWKNPWRYNINYHSKNSLFNIITSSFSDDIKNFLSGKGIKLSSVSFQPLLFDYLSFCRSMNVNVINDVISIGSCLAYNQFLLQQEFYSLFMKKFPELKYLDIRSIEHQIFYFPRAVACLDSLYELTCETSTEPSYFYGLARICDKIENLIIYNASPKVNRGIIKLIEVQRRLKYFEWEDDCEEFEEYFDIVDIYEETFLALAKKADTLIHFVTNFQEEYEFTFPSRILSEFHNLKTLKLNFHPIFDYSYDEQLKMSDYPNLETFQLDDITLISTVACMIKNSGGRLRKILVNNYDVVEDNFNEESLVLINAVREHCPLIECLSLAFPSSDEHFVDLEKLLLHCQKLRVLAISISNVNEISREQMPTDRGKLLRALTRSSSTNLREIRFFEHFKFSSESLEEFLESWKERPALSIFTCDLGYKKEEFVEYAEIINRYKNDGVIKDFKFVVKELMHF